MVENLDRLLEAMKQIWKKIADNCAVVQKRKTAINGNLGILFSDDDMGMTEKVILRSYLNVTSNISGCQALRRRIGHILFGFRCIYGEIIFLTVVHSCYQLSIF